MTMSHTILKTSSGSITGVIDDRFSSPVEHFRGIQYGSIGKRFARPELLSLTGDLDATQFGYDRSLESMTLGLYNLTDRYFGAATDLNVLRHASMSDTYSAYRRK
jgi:hypothetical protein